MTVDIKAMAIIAQELSADYNLAARMARKRGFHKAARYYQQQAAINYQRMVEYMDQLK